MTEKYWKIRNSSGKYNLVYNLNPLAIYTTAMEGSFTYVYVEEVFGLENVLTTNKQTPTILEAKHEKSDLNKVMK